MNKWILALAGAMSLLSSAALADGMASKGMAASGEAARPWTGFYIGAGIGGGAVVHDASIPGLINFDGVGGEGAFGTAIIGYDRLLAPRIVGGVFADYDFASSVSSSLSFGGIFSGSLDHDHSWSVGGRLGVLSSPTTLWYGLAGYTQAHFDTSSTAGSVDVPDFSGYFVGAGVESQLRDGWSLRTEYRFTQFNSETIAGLVDDEPSMHTVRALLTYKWGREEAYAPMK
jgi:outer membrane immunogenic protein